MLKIDILHAADQHVKHKEEDNIDSIEANLKDIVNKLRETKAAIFLFAGDLFDNANPNEVERKLAYKFIAEILHVETLQEFVFMCGNHDILSDRKNYELLKGNNSFNSLNEFIGTLAPQLAAKLTYLKEQRQYVSKCSNRLSWIPYSLEDGMSNGNNIKWELIENNPEPTYNITVFHDIVRDYVEDSKLPVRKDKLVHLPFVKDFKTDLILSGDIHKNYTKISDGKTFIYPGSTNQVSFGEKSSIKIRKNSTIFHADDKYIKLHELTFENENVIKPKRVTTDLQLDCQLSYIEVDLNSNRVVPHYLEDIEKFLRIAKFGLNQTYIKMRLSANYAKHEIEIFKLIERICTELTNKNGINPDSNFKIITSYDKFSVTNVDENHEDLLEIDEDEEEKEFNFNIDDLKLTTEKLNALFYKTLEKQVGYLKKELGDDALVKEVMDMVHSVFSEQIELLLSAIPNFTIELDSIETNGFMNLEKNVINLAVPGITKINGTNGIGKTTLLNMVRYVIRGVVFDGLKANQKKLNTLLIFNDKNINQNTVSTRMFAKVNSTQIAITRIATRKWKNNATDEQKACLEWKNYVSEVSTSLKLDVMTKDGQKTFTGDEAENLLTKWFGDVASTILILNQFKILSLLNLQSDKLQQMVLDYIGIDYLNLLKENLPAIKNNYNLKRPESTLELLKSEYIRLTKLKDDGVLDLDELLNLSKESKTSIETFELNVESKNKLLIDMGNIPNLINETDELITTKGTEIETFVIKPLLEIPVWTETQPVSTDWTKHDEMMVQNNNTLDGYKEQVTTKKTKITELQDKLVAELKVNKQNYPTQISELFNEKQKIYKEQYGDLTNQINNDVETLQNTFLKIVDGLKIKQDEKKTEIDNLISEKKTLTDRNHAIDTEVESGVCKECERPFGTDFESHKVSLLKEKTENLTKLGNIEQTHTELNKQYLNIKNFVTLYNEYYTKSINQDMKWFTELETYGQLAQKPIIDNIVILEAKHKTINEIFNNLNSQNLEYFKDSHDLGLQQLFDSVTTINDLIADVDSQIEGILKLDVKVITNNNLVDLIVDLSGTEGLIESLEKTISADKTHKETTNNNYIDTLKGYNDRYAIHVESLNNVNTNNTEINNHNNKLESLKTNLSNLKLKLVEYQNKLPDYTQLTDTLTELKTDLKSEKENFESLNTSYNTLSKELNDVDNQIQKNNEGLAEWVVFKRDTLIYSIYDKLINKEFPDIIFEYYRQYLNNSLNVLLRDMNFKLFWDKTGELYMVEITAGFTTYRPVQLVSGMQTSFLGLSLIYAIHMLNVKNNISHIFIDELSGAFNTGKELTDKTNLINYQEQFVLLINKFTEKNVWIIDHNIANMFETQTMEVIAGEHGGKYITL